MRDRTMASNAAKFLDPRGYKTQLQANGNASPSLEFLSHAPPHVLVSSTLTQQVLFPNTL